MEKVSAVDAQLSRAQLPICSQQEMVPEEPILIFVQTPARNQAEIRDEFLIFSPPGIRPLPSRLRLEGNTAEVALLGYAFYEPVIADPEDTSQYAITGC
jgi:hypothetical protein